MNSAGTTFYQRLHAIDVTTGAEKGSSPVVIAGAYPGTADGGSTVTFNSRTQNQRPGLVLMNGTIYITWAAHEDEPPYHGWIIGYTFNGTSFTRSAALNVTPNTSQGGIWMSGAAPAADANNMLYVTTGNGHFNANSTTAPSNDYGDSFLQVSPTLQIQQYFSPTNQLDMDLNDKDFGAGGAAILGDLPAGSPITHIAITGGKDGALYVINRDHMGGLGDSNAWQKVQVGASVTQATGKIPGIFAVGALWNSTLYIAGTGGPLEAYKLDPATANFSLIGASTSPSAGYPFPGSNPSISSGGTKNGIVWMLDNSTHCTKGKTCGPTKLHAYDASDVTKELWNSTLVTADAAGNAVNFRADDCERQGVHRHSRQQHRRCVRVDHRVGAAGCLRPQAGLSAQAASRARRRFRHRAKKLQHPLLSLASLRSVEIELILVRQRWTVVRREEQHIRPHTQLLEPVGEHHSLRRKRVSVPTGEIRWWKRARHVRRNGHQPEALIHTQTLHAGVRPHHSLGEECTRPLPIDRERIENAGHQKCGHELFAPELRRNADCFRIGWIGDDQRHLTRDMRARRISAENDRRRVDVQLRGVTGNEPERLVHLLQRLRIVRVTASRVLDRDRRVAATG